MASTTPGDPDFNNFEAIKGADLLVLSARRRPAKKQMLALIRQHLDAGKPLVGIRTACHAFAPLGADREKLKDPQLGEWADFDPQVLGGHYSNHYGEGRFRIEAAMGVESPLLSGVDLGTLESHGTLYKVSPLEKTAIPLLEGTLDGHPKEPVAWINSYGPNHARVFYSSLGHPDDFANAPFRRLLLNAVLWSIGDTVPPREWAVK